jgi:hypothetical protein
VSPDLSLKKATQSGVATTPDGRSAENSARAVPEVIGQVDGSYATATKQALQLVPLGQGGTEVLRYGAHALRSPAVQSNMVILPLSPAHPTILLFFESGQARSP